MARKARFIDQRISKGIKNEINPKNMKQEDGFSLSRLWKPYIHLLKKEAPGSRQKFYCLALLTQYYLTGAKIRKTCHSPPSSNQLLQPSAKNYTCMSHTTFTFLTVCDEPFVIMAISLQTLNSQHLSTRCILSSLSIATTGHNLATFPHNQHITSSLSLQHTPNSHSLTMKMEAAWLSTVFHTWPILLKKQQDIQNQPLNKLVYIQRTQKTYIS